MGWQSLTKCLQYCLRWTRHPDMLVGQVAACVEKISSEEVKETLAAETDCKKSENLRETGKASTGKYLPGLPGKDLTARWISILKSKKCNLDATQIGRWVDSETALCRSRCSLSILSHSRPGWTDLGFGKSQLRVWRPNFFLSMFSHLCTENQNHQIHHFSQQDCRNRGSLIGNKACFLNTNNTQSWTWST